MYWKAASPSGDANANMLSASWKVPAGLREEVQVDRLEVQLRVEAVGLARVRVEALLAGVRPGGVGS